MARGDVVWIDFPESQQSGHEQSGRRPAAAVEADLPGIDLPTVMVVPFTSNLTALRFPYTVKIDVSPQNGLTSPSVALCFQLRAIDRKRIIGKAGTLDAGDLSRITSELKRLLGL